MCIIDSTTCSHIHAITNLSCVPVLPWHVQPVSKATCHHYVTSCISSIQLCACITAIICQNWFLWWTPTKSGVVHKGWNYKERLWRFEDIGFWTYVLCPCKSGSLYFSLGQRFNGSCWMAMETEKRTEEFTRGIQADVQTEELPPQHTSIYTIQQRCTVIRK